MPKSDAQLLREYAEHGQEAAFAEIVVRHTNLVYSAALRQVGVSDMAAEVAQSVFVGLARRAGSLSGELAKEASLAGWLCRSARNISLNLRRDEFRRHSRERQVMQSLDDTSGSSVDWELLGPVLDEAMAKLNELDYDALVMRFVQKHDLRAVGQALGVSDDAAQKRVARALDKLRDLLSKRGISTTAATLSLAISANAVQAGPAGLAAAISTAAALAKISINAATAVKTATMTTLQKCLVITSLAALTGAGVHQVQRASRLKREVQTLQQRQAPLNDQTAQLARERDEAMRQVAALREENDRLTRNSEEVHRLRGEVVKLRNSAPAAVTNTPDRFGVPPGERPPLVSSSTREMAWGYAQLRRKSLAGSELSPAEEVHLA